jgi:hypothetical protein
VEDVTKRQITKVWVWGLAVAIVGGLLVTASSIGFALHADDLGPNQTDGLFWTMVSLTVLSAVIGGIGLILQFVGWIAAVSNTRRLADRTWYRTLLISGIVSYVMGFLTLPVAAVTGSGIALWAGYILAGLIGWSLMLAYVAAGPDSTRISGTAPVTPKSNTNVRFSITRNTTKRS